LFVSLTTAKERFNFVYSLVNTTRSGERIFGIDEQYIRWGTEGVVTAMVDALLKFEACPRANRNNLSNEERLSLKNAPQQVIDWMHRHSIQQDLIAAYSMASEKWASQKFFNERIDA
jgi:hypothetical protein